MKFLKKLKKHKREYEALKFIVRFNVFALPLYIIALLGWQLDALIQLTEFLARSLLSATGISHSVLNNLIVLPVQNGSWAAFINWECTGWKAMYAFFALVMATPVAMERKWKALVLIPLIYAINIIRIWFMFFYVANFGVEFYPFVHAVIWSWGLILVIVGLWFWWAYHQLRGR